jgi:hypothetical protein
MPPQNPPFFAFPPALPASRWVCFCREALEPAVRPDRRAGKGGGIKEIRMLTIDALAGQGRGDEAQRFFKTLETNPNKLKGSSLMMRNLG